MRRKAVLTVIFGLFLSVVAIPSPAVAGARSSATVVVSLDPAQGQLPESITVDSHGTVYMAGSPGIWKVNPDGQHQPVLLANIPLPQVPLPGFSSVLGMKVGADGYLYAASAASSPSYDAARIWRVSPTGAVQEYAHLDPNGKPNDLAFDNNGNLFVTDSDLGLIYKIGQGGEPAGVTPTVWLSDPLLAPNPAKALVPWVTGGSNGIAFDADKTHLYVDNLDEGQIIKITLSDRGQPSNVSVFASDPLLSGSDGMAFDRAGTLYVAQVDQNHISTVSRNGHVSLFASGPILRSPSSLVFAPTNGGTCSPTLYISNFSLADIFNGVQPQPALLKTPVQIGGLRLP